MTLNFKKTKPSRIFQNVVDQIQQAIINGEIKPGDSLPSEMKLKEMFDTSRGSIREALRVLEQKGLVDIKTGVGGGAIVKKIDTSNISEGLDLLVQYHQVSLEHLTEFREGVEGLVAALAAERATKTDIKHLRKLQNSFTNFLSEDESDWKKFIELDIQFHIAIADIAGNPVFKAVLQMIHENILGFYDRYALKDREIREEDYKEICELIDAIEHGRTTEAKSLAQHHVRQNYRYFKKDKNN